MTMITRILGVETRHESLLHYLLPPSQLSFIPISLTFLNFHANDVPCTQLPLPHSISFGPQAHHANIPLSHTSHPAGFASHILESLVHHLRSLQQRLIGGRLQRGLRPLGAHRDAAAVTDLLAAAVPPSRRRPRSRHPFPLHYVAAGGGLA